MRARPTARHQIDVRAIAPRTAAPLRAALLSGGESAAFAARDGGTYGHVDGPRFNTKPEIRSLAAVGVTAVSQTAGPETEAAPGEVRVLLAEDNLALCRACSW